MALRVKPQAWIGAALTRHWANWQAVGQASRQIGRHAAGWRFKLGIPPDDGPLSPNFLTNHAERFQGRCAACHLCRHADMQTVIGARMQTATITGRS